MKRCSVCGETKPLAEFAWHRREKGQYDSYCRPCRSAYKKRHYSKNRQRYIDNAAFHKGRLVRVNARRVVAYLRDNPCVDCGESDPLVLEFDHLRDKAFNVSRSCASATGRPSLKRSRSAKWSAPIATGVGPRAEADSRAWRRSIEPCWYGSLRAPDGATLDRGVRE